MLKILLLEDSPNDVELVQYNLKRAGLDFEIKITDNKKSYIQYLTEFEPDVILSDHRMPQFDSLEAIKIAKEKNIKTPFILVTGSVSEEFAVQIIHEGAKDYILKDRMARLPAAIRNALEKTKLEQEQNKYIEKIFESEAFLREAEHLAQVGSFEVDLTTNKTKWSEEMFRILGYTPGEVEPSYETFLNRVHPDESVKLKSYLEQAIGNLNHIHTRYRIKIDDETIKFIRGEIVVKRNREQIPVKIMGINQDVTRLRLAEDTLNKTEANLKTIFDNTEIAYILLDKDCNILSFNKTTNKWFKIETGRELIENTNFMEQLITDEAKERFNNHFESVFNGVQISYETIAKHNNVESWYKIKLLPVINKNNVILGAVMAIEDITERKVFEISQEKMMSEIIARNRNLEQFAYIVSHNLRGPIANMMGYSDLLKNDSSDVMEKKEIIDGISTSIIKLDDVIKDLNQILTVKTNLEEKKQKIEFEKLVENIKSDVMNKIESENIEINTNFSQLKEISSIKSYFHSIFYNLITNSIKYRRSGIPLIINIKSRDYRDRFEIMFKDNGMGIDLKRNKENLFGLYKRFHPEIEGKGMGLFMVRSQVESLGGKIKIQSEVNSGTKFTIEFLK